MIGAGLGQSSESGIEKRVWGNPRYRGLHYCAYVKTWTVRYINFNHSILIPIRIQGEGGADGYAWIPIEGIADGIGLFSVGDYDWVIQRPNWRIQTGDD